MAATLADLTVLAQFEGTRVPPAPLNGPCLSLFGQLLTHPSRVTFPWHPLRHALYTYFGSAPPHLDAAKIGSGWNGLSLILTAFKRLEVVESEEETAEVVAWLKALKMATVKRSLEYELTNVSTLQDILTALVEPLTAEELNAARTQAKTAAAAAATAATSKSNGNLNGQAVAESSGVTAVANGKHRQASSQKGKGVNGAGSADFPDFIEQDDPLSLSSDSEDEDLFGDGFSSGAGNPDRPQVQQLAQRLSDATGIPLNKCIATIARFPDDDLNSINPNAPIPAQFLPVGFVPSSQPKPAVKPPPMAAAAAVSAAPTPPPPQLQQQQQPSYVAPTPAPTSAPTRPSKPKPEQVTSDGHVVKKPSVRGQRPHDPNRPNFSYSALIGQAILSQPDKRMRLADIYDFVTSNYPYYKKNECGWQNSIRHNLSLQSVFKKVPDNTSPNKKGCFWTIVESEEWRFAGGGWTKLDKGSPGSSRGHHGGGGGGGKRKAGGSKAGSRRGSSVPGDDDDDGDSKMSPVAYSDDE